MATEKPGEALQPQAREPKRMAGQNLGLANPHPEQSSRTAYDLKAAHRLLDGITDDGLKQIPVLWEGARLEQGATYIDLRESRRT